MAALPLRTLHQQTFVVAVVVVVVGGGGGGVVVVVGVVGVVGASQFFFSLLCAEVSCLHTTGTEAYSFTTDGYGIFNVRANMGACRTHEGGSGTNKPAHELIRRDRKTVANPAPPGDRTQGLRI